MNYLSDQLKGILWMLVHCLNFSVMSVMVRLCSNEGLPIFEIFFVSNLIAFIAMVIWVLFTKDWNLSVKTPSLYISRAIVSILNLLLWFYALKMIPLGEATAISYSTPLFSTIAAIFFLHENSNHRRTWVLLIGFLGVLIIIRPGMEIIKLGILLALASSVFSSFGDIFIKIQTRTERLMVQTFYITFLMALLSFPLAIFVWKEISIDHLIPLLILGFTFLFNFFAIFKAYRYADLTVILPFDFSRLLFTLVLAYFVFNEKIDFWTIIGSAIILSCSVYLARCEYQQKKII
ncbi:MAG: DMT family transporter [Gammaproteobacteria bacterium]